MVDVLGVDLPLLLVIVGVLLGIGEAIAPGAHLIVLGVALIMAGLLGMAASLWIGGAVLIALMAASVLATGAAALFIYRELDLYGGKGMARTRDSDSLRGETGRVTERVTNTAGEVKIDGGGFNPYYRARSLRGEISEGTEVMIVDPGGGNVVTVAALENIEDEIDRELAADPQPETPPAEERESA